MKNILIITVSCLVFMTAQSVHAETAYQSKQEEVVRSMTTLLYEIEQATGRDHKVSERLNNFNEQGKQVLYDSVQDKEKFINSTNKALQRIKSVKKVIPAAEKKLPAISFPPNYPSATSDAYQTAFNLGLATSNQERCNDPESLEVFETLYKASETASMIADAACTVAGCDPSGAICLAICGTVEAVETLGAAFFEARAPMDACEKHNNAVNAAEIEASYENSKMIFELLHIPQGRRSGWNR